jgi:hypothetical protein
VKLEWLKSLIVCSPFGSHTLEKLLLQLQHALHGDETTRTLQIVGNMVNLVKEDLIDYITHKYATFFARRLLQLLTGELSSSALEKASAEKKLDIADKIKLIQQNSESATGSHECAQGTVQVQHHGTDEVGCREELTVHLHSLAQEVCGLGIDSNTLMSLQRCSYASPFLQALLRAVTDRCALGCFLVDYTHHVPVQVVTLKLYLE